MHEDENVGELAAELRVALGQIFRRIRSEHVFPMGQGAVLGALDREGPQSTSDLAAGAKMRPQSMAQTVRELEEAGYVVRRADPGDVFVLATDAVAASLLAGTDPAWERFRAHPGLPDGERLLDLLDRLSPAPNDDATVVMIVVPDRPESPP